MDWQWLFNNLRVPGAPQPMRLPGPLVDLVAEACAHYEQGEVWDTEREAWVPHTPEDTPPPVATEDTPPPVEPPVDYSQWAITTTHTGQLTVVHKPSGTVHVAQSRDAAEAVAEAQAVVERG